MRLGGLVPWLRFERDKHHGDRSQTITAKVTWLRICLEVSLNVPYGRRWSPW